MRYYEVAVARRAVREQSTLTYGSEDELAPGAIVRVPLGKASATGVVISETKKPDYATKQLERAIYPQGWTQDLIILAQWLADYYATPLPSVIQSMLPPGIQKKRRNAEAAGEAAISRAYDIISELTPEQSEALARLNSDTTGTVLLHGVTGSGKTRLYIERARQVLEEGRGVIVLVPEIGLTSQLLADMRTAFGEGVFVIHSQQKEAERHLVWEGILRSKRPVVVGPRSAVFAPIQNLGLIIIDEAHESAYKQDQSPRYDAVRAASVRAKAAGAQLVIGTATPRIEDYYLAKKRSMPIITLSSPITPHEVEKRVVDLRDKDNLSSRSRYLSSLLIETIEASLSAGHQALILHNRRGTATSVICAGCGWVAECPACFMPLTFHHDWQQLVCHVCNHRQPAPFSCPSCGEPELRYRGLGSKQVAGDLAALFPLATMARFDSDTPPDQTLARRYEELHSGKVQLIVGTQMIAKGLDLPRLQTVGIVVADTGLYLPDFSAAERTFQMVRQAIGRAGRKDVPGKVVVQSYNPGHPAIQAAFNDDYQAFYESEIAERETSNYPPFRYLLSLHVERRQRETAERNARELRLELKKHFPDVLILGPSPAFHERTPRGYRWQLVLKSAKRPPLVEIVRRHLPDRWQFELDPDDLL